MKISPANIRVNLTQVTGRRRGGRQYFTQDVHRLKKRIQRHVQAKAVILKTYETPSMTSQGDRGTETSDLPTSI